MDSEVKKTLDEQSEIQSNLMDYIEDVASSVDRVERKLDKATEDLRKEIKELGKKQDSAMVHLEFIVKDIKRRQEQEETIKEVVEDLGNRMEKVELAMAA